MCRKRRRLVCKSSTFESSHLCAFVHPNTLIDPLSTLPIPPYTLPLPFLPKPSHVPRVSPFQYPEQYHPYIKYDTRLHTCTVRAGLPAIICAKRSRTQIACLHTFDATRCGFMRQPFRLRFVHGASLTFLSHRALL